MFKHYLQQIILQNSVYIFLRFGYESQCYYYPRNR